jgi:hypothetical protein
MSTVRIRKSPQYRDKPNIQTDTMQPFSAPWGDFDFDVLVPPVIVYGI